ncbi:MAG: bacteriophage holin [Candidatus Latescibacterota bacterium]
MKLNVKAFALTCSVLWGLGVFLATWVMIGLEGASGERTVLGKFYRGYRVTPLGSLIGLLWGLADGFVGGALFGWVYNRMLEYVKGNVKEEKKHHHRPVPDHAPWLYALAHRVPGIHA